MTRELRLTPTARHTLAELERDPARAGLLRQVRTTLALLETNLRHPSLATHLYRSLLGPAGEKVDEASVQNQTPGAYGVFFLHGPDRVADGERVAVLTIVAITPHP